jgi:ankyrin repeat protein
MPEPLDLLHKAIHDDDAAAVRAVLRDHPGLTSSINDALPHEAGWPVDARGKHGATPLHWAGFHGNAAMVREILKHRPPVDARSLEFDGTPLDWTLYGSREGWHEKNGDYAATAEALLDAGAAMPADTAASVPVRDLLRRYNRDG